MEVPPPPPPPPETTTDDEVPPPPPPSTSAGDFSDDEGKALWAIMTIINEQLLVSDPNDEVSGDDVKDIQVEVLSAVFGCMKRENRSAVEDDDREFIRNKVVSMCWNYLHPPDKLRFAKLDRVVCNIGRLRKWAPGSVQSINEEDPSDPTGQSRLPYVVKIDPPESRLISVPKDTNDYVRAEVCFGADARSFTRMCLPKAIRRGSQRMQRRFGEGDRVACAVDDATSNYTNWAAGTVLALDHLVEDVDGVPGGRAPYEVRLDSGPSVLVHADEHWLVRDLALQPAGPRNAEDGTRCIQRISKRKTADGWENVDHMCALAAACRRSARSLAHEHAQI